MLRADLCASKSRSIGRIEPSIILNTLPYMVIPRNWHGLQLLFLPLPIARRLRKLVDEGENGVLFNEFYLSTTFYKLVSARRNGNRLFSSFCRRNCGKIEARPGSMLTIPLEKNLSCNFHLRFHISSNRRDLVSKTRNTRESTRKNLY